METIRWDELLSEEQWDTEARSDIELEINRGRLAKMRLNHVMLP